MATEEVLSDNDGESFMKAVMTSIKITTIRKIKA